MADTVVRRVLQDGDTLRVLMNCICDATGNTTIVADKSALTDARGNAVGPLAIKRVKGSVSGMAYATLKFDHDTDDTMLVIPQGDFCFRGDEFGMLIDPDSTGGTGDLTLTAPAGTAGAYCLVVEVAK